MRLRLVWMGVIFIFLSAAAVLAAEEPMLIRIGHTASYRHHCQQYLKRWANAVDARTAGRYRIEIYPSNLYGRSDDLLQGCTTGKTDMMLADTSLLTGYSEICGVLNLPFLFEDGSEVQHVLNGPVGEEFAADLAAKDIIVVGWWDSGMRHFFTQKPVEKPEDLEGLRIRVADSPEAADTCIALGAEPVPMPYVEIYSAIQKGKLDGCDGTIIQLLNQRYYDLLKYSCLLWYMHVPMPLVASGRLWQSLPEEDRAVFLEEARRVADFSYRHQTYTEVLEIEQCKAFGVEFTKPERALFLNKVWPVWEKYRGRYGSIIDRIQEAIMQVRKRN